MIRRLLLPTALVAAIAGPVLMTKDFADVRSDVASFWKSDSAKSKKSSDPYGVNELKKYAQPSSGKEGGETVSRPIAGAPVENLGDVLRFNITPDWVMYHWPRVTTQLSDLHLEGLRVPLLTGTKQHDLAGSLTYYFDNQQVLQRITFSGHTGDESKLVQLVTDKCGLRPVPSLYRGLYLAKWGGKPRSALRIKHAAVVETGLPNLQLEIELELNRPRRGYKLSQAFARSLDEEQQAGRW